MPRSLVVIAENIRSLHNVGALFRTLDAVGGEKLFLCGYTGTPPDRRLEKVSLGAEKTLPWQAMPDALICIQQLTAEGYTVVALEQTPQAGDIFTHPWHRYDRLALLVGNEVDGCTPEALALTFLHTQIPMHGVKHSLNVSVAAGIALYALRYPPLSS
ncbi:TrmH family RNA methyltransferase [Candidatus Peribacteria bacterium]|nr:TrmH family RNA methyltransferase [Candidatus Peribacteria bacterium]